MKRTFAVAAAFAGILAGQEAEHPTGPRITPPTITATQPRGIARGTTVEMTVEGLNLAKATTIHFDRPGIKGKVLRIKELPDLPDVRLGSNGTPSTIDLGPLPPRNQVTIEVEVDPEAAIGPVNFRLQNHLGTSPMGRFLVEPYYGESPDREPNNAPDDGFVTYLPTVLVGEISRPGDVDYFKITVRDGETLVFENGAMELGSSLQPMVAILGSDQSVIKEYGYDGGSSVTAFAHRFERAGTYYVRISDYQRSGRPGHIYRIKAGNYPLATGAFPLGVQEGKPASIALKGYGLGPNAQVPLKGELKAGLEDTINLRPSLAAGTSFREVTLAIGKDPEILSGATNTTQAAAQAVTVPVTINGRIGEPKNGFPVENYFKFRARKGQKLMLEVLARRLGSELDSMIEVLDAAGKPIEIATVRAVLEVFTVLRDHDSTSRGIRVSTFAPLTVGDWLMCGNEIMRLQEIPLGPDADILMEAVRGQRVSYFGTSSEAHAIDKPVYKVQIHPPGTQFTPNGLPLTRLYARNDDGGPFYGKDSFLEFNAPADGEYFVRIRDVRGMGGEDYAYRLNIRPPRPDFRLTVNPKNPNVPAGGTIPVTVTVIRLDGYTGPIEVRVQDLPAGLTATTGVIGANQDSTTLLISAEASAKLERAAPLKVAGSAAIGGTTVSHAADPGEALNLIALMPSPDIVFHAQTREVVLEPGGKAEIAVSVERQNGFGGRVPVEVRNLPPRVRVLDVGLNGVLLNEDEKQRTFVIEALPNAEPVEQVLYVSGRIETRSPLASSYAAPEKIVLKVKPRTTQAAVTGAGNPAERGTAPK